MPEAVQNAFARRIFDVIELDAPPKAVNARVGGKQSPPGMPPGSAEGSVLWHGVELDDLSSLLVDYGTGDDQVVPLLLCPSSEADSVELRSLFAAHHNYAETVLVRTHQYSLSFGLTNFKLQGRTLPQLILSLCHRTKTPYMTLAAFYVLVSRVRRFSALRLLYHDQAGLDKVSWLQHDPYLYAWVRGYDRANGRWSDALAASALRDVRAVREAAKARAAEAKKTKAARAKAARAKVAQGKKAAPGKQAEAAKRQQLDASRPPKKARTQQPDAQPASVTGSALGLPPAGASVQTSTPPASSSARPPPKCTLCGQLGHTFRGCKRPRDDSAGAPAAPSRIGAAANHTSHGSASGERNGRTGN